MHLHNFVKMFTICCWYTVSVDCSPTLPPHITLALILDPDPEQFHCAVLCMSAPCSCCNKRPFTGTERQCLCHHSAVELQAQTLAARTQTTLLDGGRR